MTSDDSIRYSFADLALDVGQRQVSRGDEQLDVSGLTFDLLLAIVGAAPNIISSDELVDKVWSGRPASPETITQRTMMLRQALADDADNPKYVEVIRGQGLKLIPELKDAKPKPTATAIKAPRSLLTTIGAAVVVLAIVFISKDFIGSAPTASDTPPQPVRRFAIELGALPKLGRGTGSIRSEIAVSPDGSHLAYIGASRGDALPRLYVRALDQLEARPIEGTDGARRPFFSPDGQWIGFDSGLGTEIKKVSVRGGLMQTLTQGHNLMFGASWSDNNEIAFATTFGEGFRSGRLVKISAEGGQPEELLVPAEDTAFLWPHFLPGGKHLLFTTVSGAGSTENSGNVALLALDSGEFRTIISGGFNAKYSPTGHIVFARADTLWAAPFNLDSLQVTGPELPLFDGVEYNSNVGDVIYDFSDDGLLVYLIGGEANQSIGDERVPVWVDRQGNEQVVNVPPAAYWGPQISPDGTRVAFSVTSDAGNDVWVIDLERETASRLTFDTENEFFPLWSPNSQSIFYSSPSQGGIFSRSANGTGTAEAINKNDIARLAVAVSPDGESVVVLDNVQSESDMYTLSLTGEAYPQPFIATPFDEDSAEISPDGNYIAYESNETGQNEIYIQTYPDPDGGRWQISSNGGYEPKWHPDGSKLFFRGLGLQRILVADVQTDPSFSAAKPVLYVRPQFPFGRYSYDVSAKDDRILMVKGSAAVPGANQQRPWADSRLAIIENWFEELKRIQPSETTDK
jgi:serine/threonine-protein kinase